MLAKARKTDAVRWRWRGGWRRQFRLCVNFSLPQNACHLYAERAGRSRSRLSVLSWACWGCAEPKRQTSPCRCDLLIAVGARFDDRVTGKLNTFAPHASVIHMDIDPAEMNKLRQAHVALQGDLNALLPALQQPLNINDWQQHWRSCVMNIPGVTTIPVTLCTLRCC